ncbi:MAG TPA: hypothetical protein VE863_23055 [Pyrinomonadaceae bacterium]|nr:hypothetical protein [Pyrinomonadaceae bacterium]
MFSFRFQLRPLPPLVEALLPPELLRLLPLARLELPPLLLLPEPPLLLLLEPLLLLRLELPLLLLLELLLLELLLELLELPLELLLPPFFPCARAADSVVKTTPAAVTKIIKMGGKNLCAPLFMEFLLLCAQLRPKG